MFSNERQKGGTSGPRTERNRRREDGNLNTLYGEKNLFSKEENKEILFNFLNTINF